MINALNFLIVLYFFAVVAIILFYQKAQDWREIAHKAERESEYWRGMADGKKEKTPAEELHAAYDKLDNAKAENKKLREQLSSLKKENDLLQNNDVRTFVQHPVSHYAKGNKR